MKKIIVLAIIIVAIITFWFYGRNTIPVTPDTSRTSEGTITTPPAPASTTTTPTNVTTGSVKEFIVIGSNFSFTPNTLEVKQGDTVKITFKNANGTHNFKLDEFQVATKQIKSGQSETVEFIADKTGSFEFYCSIGNHRAIGMKGTLIIK